QRFRDLRNFLLQRLVQPPQLREFLPVAEVQLRPALPQDEAVRVFRNFAQQFDVAFVFRLIDGGGQLVIRLQLVRLVGETIGMIQLHQLLPKLRQLRFLLGGQLLFLVRRRRQFFVVLVRLRLGALVIFRGLHPFLPAAARERLQKLPPVIHREPQPVALLIMLPQPPEQHRLHGVNARFLLGIIRFQFRKLRPRARHKLTKFFQLWTYVDDGGCFHSLKTFLRTKLAEVAFAFTDFYSGHSRRNSFQILYCIFLVLLRS